MCDDDIHQGGPSAGTSPLSRRRFAASAAAAGLAATAGPAASAAALETIAEDVEVRTPDGSADAFLARPASGRWPAVLIWTDILGLRPVFRDMGRRLAETGYVVLVPNPFYRSRRAPVVGDDFNFNDPAARAKVFALAAALTPDTAVRDADAFIGFLDAQPAVDRARGAGVQGYCMGGPLAFRTAARRADRIRALATFHGGGLVTDKPDSPHRLIPQMKAAAYCAVARNDDAREPTAKDQLKAGFAAAGLPAGVEVYSADHGWCVKGSAVYQEAAAEQAWSELLALYRARLV